jgi:tetratricopeptide (TPR) repeat protein
MKKLPSLRKAGRRGGGAMAISAGLLLAVVLVMWSGAFRRQVANRTARTLTYDDLVALDPVRLSQVDVAVANLLCAQGLPGCDAAAAADHLPQLDDWADHVRVETQRNLHRFKSSPAAHNNSEAFFRIGMLVTVLQQDYGVRYNPAKIEMPERPSPNSVFFADSRDLFLHGLLGKRRLGTCISLPVLYVAVGRRLGYPLKLVTTRSHLFFRWEGMETVNFEGAGEGISAFPDDYYMGWPYRISEAERRAMGYLESLTPARELALFLETRGHCLLSAGRLEEAQRAFAKAVTLDPRRAHQLAAGRVPDQSGSRHTAPRRPLSRAEVDALARAAVEQNADAMAHGPASVGVENSRPEPDGAVGRHIPLAPFPGPQQR